MNDQPRKFSLGEDPPRVEFVSAITDEGVPLADLWGPTLSTPAEDLKALVRKFDEPITYYVEQPDPWQELLTTPGATEMDLRIVDEHGLTENHRVVALSDGTGKLYFQPRNRA